MKKINIETSEKVGACNRCHDTKELNKFKLCKSCSEAVDKEYSLLYTVRDMDY